MVKLLTKLNLIMGELERIQKDAKNNAMGYEYASEKAIKEAIHPLFVKYKVMCPVSTTNPRYLEIIESNMKGEEIHKRIFAIDVSYQFLDCESGEELKGSFVGTGNGRDDKGNYAALTGAIKYIMTSTFLIPTGDDPETDGDNDVQASSADITKAMNAVDKLPKTNATQAILKGLEEAKQGKRKITRLYIKQVTQKAKEKLEKPNEL